MKIRDDVDLDKLLDYGFRKNKMIDYSIYVFDVEIGCGHQSKILVNDVDNNDRILRFNYFNDGITEDIIDYDVLIPDVIFELMKDGVIEYGGV